jgi:quinol monooxygenase YgiN
MHMFRWALPMAIAASIFGAPAHAGDFGDVVVVTHLDIIPDFVAQAQPLIEQFVLDSRKDPGVKSFIVITWDPTTNHFQLIERFQNMRAFDLHVSAKHTVDFRDQVQPFIGAPYDERLYNGNR